MVRHIEDARAAGYYTFVVYVRVLLDIALDRNRRRARSVPEATIVDKAAMVEEAIRILTSYADDIEVIDNVTPESRDRSIRQYDEVYRERTSRPGLGAPWRSARANPQAALRLWKYNQITGYWDYARSVTPETAEEWLVIFKKFEPDADFVIARYRPKMAPGGDLPRRVRRT